MRIAPMRRIPRALFVLLAVVAAVALVAGVAVLRTPGTPSREAPPVAQVPGDGGADAQDPDAEAGDEETNEEAAEQEEGIARHREALESAIAAGRPIGQQR